MGLRSAKSAQPSKLKDPVPEVGTEEVPEGQSIPVESVTYSEPLDVMSRDPASFDPKAAAGAAAQVPAVPLNTPVTPEMPLPTFNPRAAAAAQMAQGLESDDEADWWPRIKASFAITPEQEVKIYKAHYGPENVLMDTKGKISVKKPGSDRFVHADSEFKKNLKDVLGDGAGYLFRMAAQQALESGGAAIGSAAGMPIAGPGGSLLGGAVGAGAGMVASPLVADFASSQIAEAFGANEAEIDAKNRILVDGLINLGSAGAMKFVGTSLKNALRDSPINRIKSLAGVRKSIEGWVDRYGSKAESPAMLGDKVGSYLQMLEEQYGKSVGALNQAAINQSRIRAMSGGRDAIPTSNAEAKLKEVIEKYGGSLDPRDRSLVPFGKVQGQQTLSELDNMLYTINAYKKAKGGLPMRDLIDFTQKFQQLSKYDEKTNLPENILSAYREVANAFAKDRNQAFSELLTGTASEPLLKAMPYEKYTQFMEDAGSLISSYKKFKSPELFADALIQKGNSKGFLGLVRTLGKDSEMVGEIKASWLARVMDESIDTGSGILNAKKFVDELESYGKDLVKEVIGPEELGKLRVLAQRFQKISQSGLKTEDQSGVFTSTVGEFLRAFAFKSTIPIAAGNLVFRLTKGNAKAVDYIANKGWYDAVEKLPVDQQAAALAARDGFLAAMSGAKRVKLKNGQEKYVIPMIPTKGNAVDSLIRFNFQQGVIGPEQRKRENE